MIVPPLAGEPKDDGWPIDEIAAYFGVPVYLIRLSPPRRPLQKYLAAKMSLSLIHISEPTRPY